MTVSYTLSTQHVACQPIDWLV